MNAKKPHNKALKATKQHSPPEICKIFSYCRKLPAAINLTGTNHLKVCATNPHHFRERLSKTVCTREGETEKESASHVAFIANYFKIWFKSHTKISDIQWCLS